MADRKGAFISTASCRGWRLIAEGEWGMQFGRSKIYKSIFLWSGALLLIFGIGLLVWFWGYIDYLMNRDQVLFVPVRDLESGNLETHLRRLH